MRRSAVILTALLLLLSGCGQGSGIYSNYRAIEDLRLVNVLGLDADGSGILLSAVAGRSTPDEAPTILRRGADSIPQGMSALQAHTPRGQLYFAHTRYVVLGEDFAARGVDRLLDFVERDTQTRMGTAMFVIRGGTAEALITGSGEAWDAGDVLAAVKTETERRGESHVFDVRETAVSLCEYGAALICALRLTDTEGSVFALPQGAIAVPDGYGILCGGALTGFLDGAEAQAASLLLGKLGAVTQEISDGGGGTVTVELRCGAPEFSFGPGADGSPVRLDVRVAPTAVIAAADTQREQVTDAAFLARIAGTVNDTLRGSLTRVLARSRAENADFLSLGRALRTHGADPAALSADWLQTLEIRVTVETQVRHSYDMAARAGTDGGRAA